MSKTHKISKDRNKSENIEVSMNLSKGIVEVNRDTSRIEIQTMEYKGRNAHENITNNRDKIAREI